MIWPKEHGSWSLALEPVALGLLVAPSYAGVALAVAVVAAFFARRPLRIAVLDAKPERRRGARQAIGICAGCAAMAAIAAVLLGGAGWLPWTVPVVFAGSLFVWFDLQQSSREQCAEVAGAFAFASLPAVFAILGHQSPRVALALGLVMLARAIPTVLTVRATVRARKQLPAPVAAALASAVLAGAIVGALVRTGLAPWVAFAAMTVLALRSFVLLVYPRPALRASVVGMIEVALGVGYVVSVALAW